MTRHLPLLPTLEIHPISPLTVSGLLTPLPSSTEDILTLIASPVIIAQFGLTFPTTPPSVTPTFHLGILKSNAFSYVTPGALNGITVSSKSSSFNTNCRRLTMPSNPASLNLLLQSSSVWKPIALTPSQPLVNYMPNPNVAAYTWARCNFQKLPPFHARKSSSGNSPCLVAKAISSTHVAGNVPRKPRASETRSVR